MAKDKSYGRRFLYAEDLLWKQQLQSPEVEILEVYEPGSLTAENGQVIDRWTLGFRGKAKLLVLCQTSVSIIHTLLGDPPGDEWIGHKIKLQVRIVQAFGEMSTAIRVVPPRGTHIRRSLHTRLGKPATFDPERGVVIDVDAS